MYLLDTNVISEMRRPKPHGAVLAWLEGVDDADLHLSAATLGEIQRGIEKTRANDPAKAAVIEAWLEDIAATFNILSMDTRTFRLWARLMHKKQEHLLEDAMIAATALVHDLVVVTRNVKDFEGLGVRVVNPWLTAK
jgi:toxin FitB